MADVVHGADGAGVDDLVLEVRRVEDARTVTQRLHVSGEAWRASLDLPASAGPEQAYAAERAFWDWLAEEYAETEPGTPSASVEAGTREVDRAWLQEKHKEWRARR